jgi:hypothetical protein
MAGGKEKGDRPSGFGAGSRARRPGACAMSLAVNYFDPARNFPYFAR